MELFDSDFEEMMFDLDMMEHDEFIKNCKRIALIGNLVRVILVSAKIRMLRKSMVYFGNYYG